MNGFEHPESMRLRGTFRTSVPREQPNHASVHKKRAPADQSLHLIPHQQIYFPLQRYLYWQGQIAVHVGTDQDNG